LSRTGNVCQHQYALGREQVDEPPLDLRRSHTDVAEDAVGHGTLTGVLDQVHPPVDFDQALCARADPDGELRVHEPKPVTKLARQRLI
jgi:hypothetical protein